MNMNNLLYNKTIFITVIPPIAIAIAIAVYINSLNNNIYYWKTCLKTYKDRETELDIREITCDNKESMLSTRASDLDDRESELYEWHTQLTCLENTNIKFK
uniref:Uncharacterized protein n=1 Tax=viral metagenome TaxID=1070528 RepID=A0A6C0J9D5_9ZZZZ